MKAISPSPFIKSLLGVLVGIGASPLVSTVEAQVTWAAGASPDLRWSESANWTPSGSPAGLDVTFGDAHKTTFNTPNNVVAADTTIRQLNFRNTGNGTSDWHVTEIGAGVTLTIANVSAPTYSLDVGGMSGIAGQRLTTLTAFTGEGTLRINQSNANVRIGNTGSTSFEDLNQGYATLDLSRLAAFDATVNIFYVGNGRSSNGTLVLAADSKITATALAVGDNGDNIGGKHSALLLGASTTIHSGAIRIAASATGGKNMGSGKIGFGEEGENGTVIIRGQSGGDSRALMSVGDQGNDIVTNNVGLQTAVADFTKGVIDARLGTLTIGRGRGSSTSKGLQASFSMDAGLVSATSVRVGNLGNASSTSVTAEKVSAALNILGGVFETEELLIAQNTSTTGGQVLEGTVLIGGTAEVSTTKAVVLGGQAMATGRSITAVLDISGGRLTVGGDIAEGLNPSLVSSTLALRGGTLNLKGHNIVADTFALEKGTLQNLGQFNSGASLVKTTDGTVTLSGTLAHTGVTSVSAGKLLVDGELTHTAGIMVAAGATLGGSGEVHAGAITTVATGGTLAPGIDTLNLGGSLLIEDAANFAVTLGGDLAGSYGKVSAQSVSLDGANLELSLTYAPVMGEFFTLISLTGDSAISGTFATINGNAFGIDNQFTLDYNSQSYQFQLFYTGDGSSTVGGNDLVLTVIPEPASVLLLLGGAAGLVLGARRRRSVAV